jgi:hypothetical protein
MINLVDINGETVDLVRYTTCRDGTILTTTKERYQYKLNVVTRQGGDHTFLFDSEIQCIKNHTDFIKNHGGRNFLDRILR